MIQPNNNTSVLPFYNDIELQNHRRSYAYGQIYPLYTPCNHLLPFQIVRKTRQQAIRIAKIYNKDGSLYRDILAEITRGGLELLRYETKGYDVIVYPDTFPILSNQAQGVYYLVLSDGVETWYSDLFTCVTDISSYLKIEWFDESDNEFDGGSIIYKDVRFRNNLYFATEVGMPGYEFEEQGENRDGLFFAQKQISYKTYKFVIVAPEFLCDVMRFIRMADHVTITDHYGRVYECDTFLMTPKWLAQGNLASVEVEFRTDTVVKKLGLGYIRPADRGDYNIDFNNDYNNQ